jgi:hypothetical protein
MLVTDNYLLIKDTGIDSQSNDMLELAICSEVQMRLSLAFRGC